MICPMYFPCGQPDKVCIEKGCAWWDCTIKACSIRGTLRLCKVVKVSKSKKAMSG